MLQNSRLVAIVALATAFALPVFAQVQTSTPPFSSLDGGPEVINLGNLNAHWTIPVLHRLGRGTNFIYDLSDDSSVWYPVTSGSTTTWQPVAYWGWTSQTEPLVGYVTYNQSNYPVPAQCQSYVTSITKYSQWAYHDNLGRTHYVAKSVYYINGDPAKCNNLPYTATTVATDGSGFTITVAADPSATVTARDGSSISPPLAVANASGNYTDRNGNQITADGSGHFYDTLSSTTPVLTVSGSAPSSTTFTYNAPSGSPATYTMSYVYYTVATNFAVSGIHEYGATPTYLVDKVTLPDGSFYQFSYEPTASTPSTGACLPRSGTYQGNCVTGRVVKVTLPTRGYISYAYSGGGGTNNSGIFSDGSTATLARTLNDGSTSNQWTYTRTQVSGNHWRTTITTPGDPTNSGSVGNDTVIDFQEDGSSSQNFYETQRVSYQGASSSNVVLQITTTCYNTNTSSCSTTAVSSPVTQRNVTKSIPTTGSGTVQTQRVEFYNSVGMPSEVDEYAFGSGAPPATPARKTVIGYAPLGNITAFSKTVTAEDGNNNVLAQTTYNYDETTPVSAPASTPQLHTVSGSRGNLTSVQRCTNTSSCSTSYIQTATVTYDTAGQIQAVKDGNGNQTSFDYTDNFFTDSNSNPPNPYTSSVPTDAFVKTVTLPASGSIKHGYYYYSGQRASTTDQNNNSSYTHFQDSLSRLTSAFGPTVSYPGGSGMSWSLQVYAASDTQVDSYTGIDDTSYAVTCGRCRHDQAVLDGLGRNIHGYLKSDPEGTTEVDTIYDALGRTQKVSHPYRSTGDSTYGLETPTYDALGRTTKLTHSDSTYFLVAFGANVGGAGVNTNQLCSSSIYGLGYPALLTDESGRRRETWRDAFGRIIEGDEPDSSGNLTSYTCYSYDVLGNNLKIVHGGQTRTYAYDPLSRPTLVTIPERADSSGQNCAATYMYDGNSNVKTRVAPAPNQTSCTTTVTSTYSYDAVNRVTKISYSDGTTPTVQYGYDGNALSGCGTPPPSLADPNPKGNRTAMCDSSGATSWAHDAAGRITTESRIISGVNQIISYAYNLDGSIASVTYPSGKTITYSVSNAQRLTAAKDNSGGTQFVIGASYAPPGGLSGLIAGQVSGGFAGITEGHAYNNSLEYASTSATSGAGTSLNLTLNYNLNGGDNGTLTTITNNVDNGRTQTLAYDPLNRISSTTTQATSGVDCRGQSFSPDALANLNAVSVTQCSALALSVTVDGNNHINTSGYAYDAAGNMTQDGGGYTHNFDAENRLTFASGMSGGPYCYVYDGNGLRVAKKSGASSCSSGTLAKIYWRSLSGDALAETDGTGSTTNSAYNEYVFFAGRRVGSRNGSGAIFYSFADQLGTTRSINTGNGPGQTSGQLCYDADFSPYGQDRQHGERLQTATCPPSYKFTGYERDPETGLDYAFARYYSSRLGRFLSTDSLGGSIGSLQSHNAYAYVLNNPPNLIDPSGTDSCDAENWSNCPPIMRGWGLAGNSVQIGWDEFELMGIPVVSFTPYYLQGNLTLNGLPALVPDTFWVSDAINPDTWNVPIVQLLVYITLPERDDTSNLIGRVNKLEEKACRAKFIAQKYGPGAEKLVDNFSVLSYIPESGKPGDALKTEAAKTTAEVLGVKGGLLGLGYGTGWFLTRFGGSAEALGIAIKGAAVVSAEVLGEVGTGLTAHATFIDLEAAFACRK